MTERDRQVEAEMKGLAEHNVPPRILNDDDFSEDAFAGKSKQARHREKRNKTPRVLLRVRSRSVSLKWYSPNRKNRDSQIVAF